MRPLGPTSIRERLLSISMAISLLTLSVAASLFVFNDVRVLRGQMVRDLEVLSEVVGDNSLSALVFAAPETAEKNLASLRREYQIRYAALYDADGRLFAEYRRDPGQDRREPLQAGEGVFLDTGLLGLGRVDVVRALSLEGQPVGRIFIHARMEDLAAQVERYVWWTALLFLITLAVSLPFALRLQRRVSGPILHLAAKTREISARGDYSVRVSQPDTDDEIATLFHGFNAMLEQIDRREQELAHIRARLERLVEERTRAQKALQHEQRLILEALPLGVIHLVGRRIVRANTRAVELLGWRAEEMLGLSTEFFAPSRERSMGMGPVGHDEIAGGVVYRGDRILRRKDGRHFWCRVIGQYIDPDHPRMGSVWILDDIDRDKALEAELQRARDAAEANSRAKDVFMANMSHELRTPLNSVLGFAQLLESDGRLDAEQRQHVKGIRQGGQRLMGLINDVLDLAKIEADRFELVPVEWDSGELLQELKAMFGGRAARKGIELRIEPEPGLPRRLRGDAKRVHQILVNLLDNAIKYTDAGAVTLRTGFGSGQLSLEVADTGVGIAAGQVEHIFEPFHQAGGTDQRQGTGLGLAISKRLVERMGGTIAVDATPGLGTTFRVRIPAEVGNGGAKPKADGPSPVPATGYRRTDGQPRRLRVLIADDERENRAVLRGLLEGLGFEVEEAEDGKGCIARAATKPPDLVLMDLRMPEMDGLEATRALRADAGLRHIPIVAVTAAAFGEDRARALAAGCDGHLAKPVLRGALVERLAGLLPVEWLRGEAAQAENQPLELDALNENEWARLAKLVHTGSVTAIKTMAEELAKTDCCPRLAERIASLADAFDLAGLRRLIAGRVAAPGRAGDDGAER